MPIPFDPKELEVAGRLPSWNPAVPGTVLFNFPVNQKEAYQSLTLKKDEEPTAEQKASLAAHKAVLDDVRKRVHQMTAGVPLNKY